MSSFHLKTLPSFHKICPKLKNVPLSKNMISYNSYIFYLYFIYNMYKVESVIWTYGFLVKLSYQVNKEK